MYWLAPLRTLLQREGPAALLEEDRHRSHPGPVAEGAIPLAEIRDEALDLARGFVQRAEHGLGFIVWNGRAREEAARAGYSYRY